MTQQERRRFVRIDDRLLMNIRQGEASAMDNSQPFESQAYQFQYLDNQISMCLTRVRAKNSDLADVLNLLNQKVNIAFQTSLKQQGNEFYAYQDVSISACGLSAPCDLSLSAGDDVWVSLLLPPFNSPINTAGIVVPAEESRDDMRNENHVRIDFVDLGTDQEETLIQYVIRRQNEQLIAARREKENRR